MGLSPVDSVTPLDSTGLHMESIWHTRGTDKNSVQNLLRIWSDLDLVRILSKKIGSNTAISGQKNSEWILIRSGRSVERPQCIGYSGET